MVKFRLTAIAHESEGKEYPITSGMKVSKLLEEILEKEKLLEMKDVFQVIANGEYVSPDDYEFLMVFPEDNVIISPRVQGGSFGQIFKSVVVTVVAVAVTYFTAGLGTVASAALAAVAAVGTTLVLNALIPPPQVGMGGGGLSSDADSSQMYSITGQSNSMNKYGAVPKVYGTHRIFPTVVANPYTEIEVDKSTGELVQFFYAIYDFGHGPMTVQDLRIGDTPMSDFYDFEFNLVDLNRPEVDEGVWDSPLKKNFNLYKGDVSTENVGAFINQNEVGNGAAEDYQIYRTTALNPNNKAAEITLTFVNPQGLTAYNADGSRKVRNIDMRIEFRKVGDTEWRNFNDYGFVSSVYFAGGAGQTSPVGLPPYLVNDPLVSPQYSINPYYSFISEYYAGTRNWYERNEDGDLYVIYLDTFVQSYGFPKDTDRIKIKNDPNIFVGQVVVYDAKELGRITEIQVIDAQWIYVVLDIPLEADVEILLAERYAWRVFKDTRVNIPPLKTYNTYGIKGKFIYDLVTGPSISIGNGGFTISRNETSPVYSTARFKPREYGQYEIKITRVRSYPNGTTNMDTLALQSIMTRLDSDPIITTKRHVFLELRIRATNQLNGAIQNLSGVATSVLDIYDPVTETWGKGPTSNPAWVFVDLLTGQINKKKLSKERLHLPSILEWKDYCDEVPTSELTAFTRPRFETNFVLDFNTSVNEIVSMISSSANASLNIINGKYGVLIDKKKNIPVQVFTTRNSWGFSSTRNYFDPPHGLKISFISPADSWSPTEIIVYDRDYTAETAETFDEMTAFACTNSEQAWRYGRFQIAQSRLRQETISISVDFENLVCTRGDYVRIAQDVMKVGGIPARVKSVVGDVVTIDDALVLDSSLSLGYLARGVDGIVQGTCTLLSARSIQVVGVIPKVGELIIIGELGKVWFDCLVKAINMNDDLSAQLTLVEKADAIYDAESSATITEYDPQLTGIKEVDVAPASVTDLIELSQTWACGANEFVYYITIDWEVPPSTAYEFFEVYVDSGRGFNMVGETRDSSFTYTLDSSKVDNKHTFKVLAVSASGKKKELIEAPELEVTPAKKLERPKNILKLSTNITGEVLQLDWETSPDCIKEYLIRYSPLLTGTWENSIPLLRADRNTTMASTQARTGTYLIKAVDFYDNESKDAIVAITTIPELFNLNYIADIDDFPALEGTKYRTEALGSSLVLKTKVEGGVEVNEYYPEGFYYYQGFLDLGEIYTVRLQSLIQAEGYTIGDIMSNWVRLSDVEALSRSKFSEWDVHTEYRSTDRFNVMSEWPALDLIDPISEGYQELWTDWRKITVNDATGRIFQFRLRLISNKASVSPRVYNGRIKADMPDRIENYQDVETDLNGEVMINYTPAFKGPASSPSVQITLENGRSGDYWEFSQKDLNGFEIKFFDKDGTPVQRKFDAVVKGYGRKALSVI